MVSDSLYEGFFRKIKGNVGSSLRWGICLRQMCLVELELILLMITDC
jgi:hypothetical protein